MIKKKQQMFIVIGVFVLVLLLGTTTYAFFNYTKTGTANTVRTGRISFSTNQTDTIGLTNAFPITRILAETDATNTDDVVITITGDTSYSGGIEYLVTATDVTNTIGSGANAKTVPISIIPTISSNMGTSDDSYFTNRGGNSSIYKVLANETVYNNDQLLVGYIAPDNNQTGVNGSITIRAYLDSDLVAISDTYNDGNTPTDNKGTPASFGENKTVLTTTEWNNLQTNGVSFKVKVEARENTWVEGPIVPGTISSCPGCKFVYTNNFYYRNQSTTEDFIYNNDILVDDYRIINESIFLGFKIENNIVVKAYACGLKDSFTPYCIEGTEGGSSHLTNVSLITGETLWNDPNLTLGRCFLYEDRFAIGCGNVGDLSSPTSYESGYAYTMDDFGTCWVDPIVEEDHYGARCGG